MTSASSASSTLREHARDTAKDAREGVSDIGKTAAAASDVIQDDLQALRDDFGRLAEQVGDLLAGKGNAAFERARSKVGSAVSDAQGRGREAVGAMRDVSDNFVDAVDESIKNRPYATLALVAGLAFLFGATWRR